MARPQDVATAELNIASSLFIEGRLTDALKILDRYSETEHELTARLRHNLAALRAQVLQGPGRHDEAGRAALEALSLAEQTRTDLRAYDARMSWQASEEHLLEIAVFSALDSGQPRRALELAEQARSRVLAEQLAAGHLPLPDAATEDAELERRLEQQRDLLLELGHAMRVAPPDFVDYESVRRLRELDADIDLLRPGGDCLDPEKVYASIGETDRGLERVRSRIEALRLQHSPARAVRLITAPELVEVLSR